MKPRLPLERHRAEPMTVVGAICIVLAMLGLIALCNVSGGCASAYDTMTRTAATAHETANNAWAAARSHYKAKCGGAALERCAASGASQPSDCLEVDKCRASRRRVAGAVNRTMRAIAAALETIARARQIDEAGGSGLNYWITQAQVALRGVVSTMADLRVVFTGEQLPWPGGAK